MKTGARFTPCRRWRRLLWRQWGAAPPALFVGLNPSTADETANDPTVTRCQRYAERWGCGGLLMTNLFGWRSTDPAALYECGDPVGPGNDAAILRSVPRASVVVLAWGNHGRLHGQDAVLLAKLRRGGAPLFCLGRNANGTPKHPLYLRSAAPALPFA